MKEQRRDEKVSSLHAETETRPPLEGRRVISPTLPPIVQDLLMKLPDNHKRSPSQELALELLTQAEKRFRNAFRFLTNRTLVAIPFGDAIASMGAEDELEKWLITSQEHWRWLSVRAYLRETVQRFEIPWDPDEWLKPDHLEDVRV